MQAKLIYFSGITLSLYSNDGLGRFLAIIEMARQQGVKIAFDGNFRPAWLARKPAADAHRVHGSLEAGGHGAAGL